MKVAICIPSPERVHPDFSLTNLPAIINECRSIKGLEIYTLYKTGVMTSSNRNWMLKECLESGIDAILWLDADMLYPPDILKVYLESKKDIIAYGLEKFNLECKKFSEDNADCR